eukprot:GHVR01122067.1.p1 GENE.GHVR01122067.1~~GHVR01122067.1.p1  ORF type:complete len:238 (+),score=42.88 GHVR01122067.1:37-750(+)
MDRSDTGVVELGEFILKGCNKNCIGVPEHLLTEVNAIMTAIKLGAKVCNREISKTNSFSVDEVKPIEHPVDFANRRFIDALVNRGVVAGVAMQPLDTPVNIDNNKNLVCLMTPLDGTRQIDVNVSVGTIFSIYSRITKCGESVQQKDFLQKGKSQLLAGYVVYGSSTMIVISFGKGVFGFTLDPSLGTFYLSHPNMKYPENGRIYSVNGGKKKKFSTGCDLILAQLPREKLCLQVHR